MPIQVNCPKCGKKLKIADAAAGKKVKCPACDGVVLVPVSDDLFGDEPEPEPKPEPPTPPPQAKRPRSSSGGATKPASKPAASSKPPEEDDLFGGIDLSGIEKDSPETEDRKPCPVCGEMIVRTAKKCRFCGEDLADRKRRKDDAISRPRQVSYADDDDLTCMESLFGVFCSGCACIMALVWIIQGKQKGYKLLGISVVVIIFWNVVRAALLINLPPPPR